MALPLWKPGNRRKNGVLISLVMINLSREQRMVICNSIISEPSFCVLFLRGVKESSGGARFAIVTEWCLRPKSCFLRAVEWEIPSAHCVDPHWATTVHSPLKA